MKETILITDLTRMSGSRVCLAGYMLDGTCVRPLFRYGVIDESWLYMYAQPNIRPFAKVTFDFVEHKPDPPHSEDWLVRPSYWEHCGVMEPGRRKLFLQSICDRSVADIFGTEIHQDHSYHVKAGCGVRSLGTIKAQTIGNVSYGQKTDGKWDYRLAFTDEAGLPYRLAVTDLAFRYFLEHVRVVEHTTPNEAARHLTQALAGSDVYLRIGLARGWEKYPGRCYLQITGIYSEPDYLGGRCFADFPNEQSNLVRPRAVEDVPF